MLKYILMVCFFFHAYAQTTPNQPTASPIAKIMHNYENHLLKLKDKYEYLHPNGSRVGERSAGSALDSKDEIIDALTGKDGDDPPSSQNSTIFAPSPFELPVRDIGILPEPSTSIPKFPYSRRLKYLTQYVKRKHPPTTKKEEPRSLISGDTMHGIESIEPVEVEKTSTEESPIRKVDGDSKRIEVKDEANVTKYRHDGRQTIHGVHAKEEEHRKSTEKIDKKKLKKQDAQTYSAANLFAASMSDDNRGGHSTQEKPMQKGLPIRRLEDARPVELDRNRSSSTPDDNSDDMPFLMKPDLFSMLASSSTVQMSPHTNDTSSATTINQPITTKIVDWLTQEESTFVTEGPNIKDGEADPTISSQATKGPEDTSTLINSIEASELEPADMDVQIDLDRIYRSSGDGRRRLQSLKFFLPDDIEGLQYTEDDEDFPIYSHKRYHRFGRRRKPMHYDDEEDFDFYSKRDYPRKKLWFPQRVKRPQAIPLPISSIEEDNQIDYHTQRIPTPQPPNRYSTLKNGVAGKHRQLPPVDLPPVPSRYQQIRPEASLRDRKQQKAIPPTSSRSRPDLQMSVENCRKVYKYSTLFGVPDPQSWIRNNCLFVQTFVKAPCEDINKFVDSCYRFKLSRR